MTTVSLRVVVTHPGAALYGSDRMLLETVRGLLADGASPVLVVPEGGPLVDAVRALDVPVEIVGTPVLRKAALTPAGLLGLALSALPAAWRGWRLLARHAPDVVYVNTMTTPLWLLLARLRGVPLVAHVHEAEPQAPALVQQLLALPLHLSTSLVVNSRFALDVLTRAAPRLAARSTVVLNGVAGPPHVTAPAEHPHAPIRLLYLGRLSERKGVLVALDAVELLLAWGLDVTLDLVGDVFATHTDFGARLAERSGQEPLAGRLAFRGFDDDIWTHLGACDVLLVPSLLPEPFGNTAVEGVLAARPVVASDHGGLPEAVGGYRTSHLVAPGDAAALAGGIRAAVAALPTSHGAARADAADAAVRHDPARYRADVVEHIRAAARAGAPVSRAR